MEFVKEFSQTTNTVVIRTNRIYDSSLKMFVDMYNQALGDGFYNLALEDVTVKHYAGKRYAGTFGIEFSSKSAPHDYERISHVEDTL